MKLLESTKSNITENENDENFLKIYWNRTSTL